MDKNEKAGLRIALDILRESKRYRLCWEFLEECDNGEYIIYDEIKRKIIERLKREEKKEN